MDKNYAFTPHPFTSFPTREDMDVSGMPTRRPPALQLNASPAAAAAASPAAAAAPSPAIAPMMIDAGAHAGPMPPAALPGPMPLPLPMPMPMPVGPAAHPPVQPISGGPAGQHVRVPSFNANANAAAGQPHAMAQAQPMQLATMDSLLDSLDLNLHACAAAVATPPAGAGHPAEPNRKMKRPRKTHLLNLRIINPIPYPARAKYESGTHGAKNTEQGRLTKGYGQEVSGDTHESEHPIGFEPINQTNPEARGTKGRTKFLENHAPAYQEVHDLHRDHIGTGTHAAADASGFNSASYRLAQRELLMQNNPQAAVQLNQLAYAFDSRFNHGAAGHDPALNIDRVDLMQANDSYFNMLNHVKKFDFADDVVDPQAKTHMPRNRTATFQPGDAVEMLAARTVAQIGRMLNGTELNCLDLVIAGQIRYSDFVVACAKKNMVAYFKSQGIDSQEAADLNARIYAAPPASAAGPRRVARRWNNAASGGPNPLPLPPAPDPRMNAVPMQLAAASATATATAAAPVAAAAAQPLAPAAGSAAAGGAAGVDPTHVDASADEEPVWFQYRSHK